MDLSQRMITLDQLRNLVAGPAQEDPITSAPFTCVEIERGMFLLAREIELEAPLLFESRSFQAATLSVVLDGEASVETPGVDTGFRPNEVWVASDNDHRPCRTILHAARPVRTVELVMTPEWVANSPRAGEAEREVLYNAMQRPLTVHRSALDAHLRRVAWQVLRAPAAPGLAALVLESRALDMLVGLVETLGPAQNVPSESLRARDRDRIMAVRARIDGDPASVVSLVSLAEEFGVSASKLKRDFFSAFTTCAGSYVNEQRLLLGRTLIEREGLSVSEAAYRAGYGHPTNFSTAFRRRFGFPPSNLRR